MRIDIPTVTPEVLEAVANMYNVAAKVMREGNDPFYESRKNHAKASAGNMSALADPIRATPGFTESEEVRALRAESAELVEVAGVLREGSEELRTPTANVTVNMPTVGDEGLDSAGNMWDASLHTRTKTKVADGTWKFQRGKKPADATVAPTLSEAITGRSESLARAAELPEFVQAVAVTPNGQGDSSDIPQTLTPEQGAAAIGDALGVPVAVEYPTAMGPFIAWVSNNGYTNVQVQTILEEWKIEGLTALDGNAELIASICKELQK